METVTRNNLPGVTSARSICLIIRCAFALTSYLSLYPGENTTNSSPPSLATMSSASIDFLSAPANRTNTRSPSICPYVSLTLLKLSISIMKKVPSHACCSSALTCSDTPSRFLSPVSGSRLAMAIISCCFSTVFAISCS